MLRLRAAQRQKLNIVLFILLWPVPGDGRRTGGNHVRSVINVTRFYPSIVQLLGS
jgi:hypothetical protein